MAIGLTLTPNASVVAGESESRPIIERVPLQTLVGDEVGSNLRLEREARSIQAEFPADSPEFRWPSQTCMGNRDGVQGTVEFARPEVPSSHRSTMSTACSTLALSRGRRGRAGKMAAP
jgi:hypothetical protein